ncbi:MAG: alpha-amylase family glycosyl hydrolase, partial [Bacteroidota bacterium]
ASEEVTRFEFTINGEVRDGLPLYDPSTGVFRFELDQPVAAGAQFRVEAEAGGETVEVEIGERPTAVGFRTEAFRTVKETVPIRARIGRPDGTADPDLTEATLTVNGESRTVPVESDGEVRIEQSLVLGENTLVLAATVDGEPFESEALVITRRLHPLDATVVSEAQVTDLGGSFRVTVAAEAGAELEWTVDQQASTSTVTNEAALGNQFSADVSEAGEVYVDLVATSTAGLIDRRRYGFVVEEDGSVREMAYDETPAWVNQAVVYEIFPLTFGPLANGTEASPGRRFQEITDELDYIAEMGFTVIWFMPVFENQFMDPISGGYNIVDFYRVDPKLGTNDDFKALVDRAHDLGLKVILDLTPNHVSPIHPWVNALRDGAYEGVYVQTEPSAHNLGLDNRGPNLREIWQTEAGRNLYRKYDGFGDLANLDWNDDDLQAEMLDVLRFWVQDMGIDGWRFDVYWGPWRRYGPERFGEPIRQYMKRIKPDSWLLGEIAGTGGGTEVYYTDDENGSSVVGGIDAGYDWNFYFNGIRGRYGDLGQYHALASNGGFWPGPNARYFRFLENHDEERIAKLYATNPQRILPLTGFLMTTTGVPMIYQGQEVNYGAGSGDTRRTPVNWRTERNGRFAQVHQQLAHARTQFPAFWTQRLEPIERGGSVYAFSRPYLDETALVLVNFASASQTYTFNPAEYAETSTDGPLVISDLFADSSFVQTGPVSRTLDPYETVVYIAGPEAARLDLPALPELPFNAVFVQNEAADVPDAFGLTAAYPNPFAQRVHLRYALDVPASVRLDVFDVLGRRVATLARGEYAAGVYEADWTADGMPAGAYFVRLKAAGRTAIRQVMLSR